jgi:hypothetical protein
MLVKVAPDAKTDFKASNLEGIDYDRCPNCGSAEEPVFRLPGRSIYSCDLKKGGCGASHARTDKRALREDHSKGINTKWPSHSAAVNRSISVPSQSYRDNYERVFGHD